MLEGSYSYVFQSVRFVFSVCAFGFLYSFALPCDCHRAPAGNLSSIFDELLDSDGLAEVDDGSDITGGLTFLYFSSISLPA